MSFTWDMPIDETTDWTHVDFLNMFWDAIIERQVYAGVSAADFDDRRPSVGDPAITVARAIHFEAMRLLNLSVPPTFDPAAEWASDNRMQTRANASKQTIFTLTGQDNYRARPREVASPASAADQSGNAVANGQRALVNFGAGVGWAAAERIEGAWVRRGVTPDRLDNRSAAPNALTQVSATGDYFGPWVFNEARDALNAARVFAFSALTVPEYSRVTTGAGVFGGDGTEGWTTTPSNSADGIYGNVTVKYRSGGQTTTGKTVRMRQRYAVGAPAFTLVPATFKVYGVAQRPVKTDPSPQAYSFARLKYATEFDAGEWALGDEVPGVVLQASGVQGLDDAYVTSSEPPVIGDPTDTSPTSDVPPPEDTSNQHIYSRGHSIVDGLLLVDLTEGLTHTGDGGLNGGGASGGL